MTPAQVVFLNIWWGLVLIIVVAIYCSTLYHRSKTSTSVFRDDTPQPSLFDDDDDGGGNEAEEVDETTLDHELMTRRVA